MTSMVQLGSGRDAARFDASEDDEDDLASADESPNLNQQLQASRDKAADSRDFELWVREKRKEAASVGQKRPENEDSRTASWFIHEAEQARIIDTPRDYQIELFERAKAKNTIAVLDTGTGKTLIAALLLSDTIDSELESRKAGQSPRISFFLVDKIALVHQQCEVLKANLAHPIACFWGERVDSARNKDFWKQQTEDNMVIVCTAAVLLHCLYHSYVRIDQINLLIFDEAHHTKKNHPYARIIKDFYIGLEDQEKQRPRILGMTASPVDAKIDVRQAAEELEALLHSEIATVPYNDMLKNQSFHRPREFVVEYHPSGQSVETVLWKKISQLVSRNPVFNRLLVYSKACASDLGLWCADYLWHAALNRREVDKLIAQTSRNFHKINKETPISALDDEIASINEVSDLLAGHIIGTPKESRSFISHKVEKVLAILRDHFNPRQDRCIIFVEQRFTAMVLADLLQQRSFRLTQLKPGILLGSNGGDVGEMTTTFRNQMLTLHRFRNGAINCLLTTTVGEEGIDIPDCNMIIRFDPCKTMIQYIQSRGRARHKDSKLFHLVESGNQDHKQIIDECHESEGKLREFIEMLPEDRLLKGGDYDVDYFLSKERTHRVKTVPSTQAKLTYKSSLVVLATFVSTLPHPDNISFAPEYIIRSFGQDFQCEVILPQCSPLRSAVGRQAGSKQVAKCSAAFEMCIKLLEKKYLDENLRSRFTKILPAMRNAQLAVGSKKQMEYSMRLKPEIWSRLGFPEKLHLAVLGLSDPTTLGRPSRPLALVTREPLPDIASFPVFLGNGKSTMVVCTSVACAFELSHKQVMSLNDYSLRIFNDLFNKEYDSNPQKMPYFLAPLHVARSDNTRVTCPDPGEMIDWDEIRSANSAPEDTRWNGDPSQLVKTRFVIDPHDGSRRFYTLDYRPDLKPSDPQLPSAPMGQRRIKASERETYRNDIWNYSISLFAQSRSKLTRSDDLPVVEAEYVPLRRNMLDEHDEVEPNKSRCYIIFKTLLLSSLSVDVVVMAYLLPAIIHRVESNLIVLEACQRLDFKIPSTLALEAMTKDCNNSEEHGVAKVNFQGGMGNNYERLEFLGDTFLKMGTSIALFVQFPDGNEYDYHVERMLMICNKNLFSNARETRLEEYIRTRAFSRRTWYPPGLDLLKGKQNKSQIGKDIHTLADKSIADVCEALIGAAYLTSRDTGLDLAVRAVTKMVKSSNHTMEAFADYYKAFEVPAWQSSETTAAQEHVAIQIERKLGHRFRYPRLLRSALNHASHGQMWENIPTYQRLEFLGDSLLDMACVDYLFRAFPGADPQWLTEHKMAMVSNRFLAFLAVRLGLHKHMQCHSDKVRSDIARYASAVDAVYGRADGEEPPPRDLGETHDGSLWTGSVNDGGNDGNEGLPQPPKVLADLVEAYMGAVFVDSGFDFNGAIRDGFFTNHILPYFAPSHGSDGGGGGDEQQRMRLYDSLPARHPVTMLTSSLQQRFHCARGARFMIDEIPASIGSGGSDGRVICAVYIHGAVRAHAAADTARSAKFKAASRLLTELEELGGMGSEEVVRFRRAYDCDCKSGSGSGLAHQE